MSHNVNLENTVKSNTFVCIVLTLSFLALPSSGTATTPRISTSVDDFRCVCPGERVHLTCSARGSWSHSWSSQDYFGRNAIIEFSQDYDRPGKGKRVSLPGGRSSLAQMTAIDASNLQICIPGNLNETRVTCTNDHGATVTRTFIHSREPPAPPTFAQPTFIAENASDGIKVYRFNWELPANFENVDINHFKFQFDNESSITLVGNITGIVLPLSYGEHNVRIVAVDRCGQESEANILHLDVMKGVTNNQLTYYYHENDSEKSPCLSSATGIMSMLNVLYFMLSLLFVFILSMY